jgi:hypothetical protein
VKKATITSLQALPSIVPGKVLDLFWDVEVPRSSDPFIPRFRVMCSETETGPWEPDPRGVTTTPFMEGVMNSVQSNTTKGFARLEVLDADGKVVTMSDPMHPAIMSSRQEYLTCRSYIKKENLVLQKKTGADAIVIRKTLYNCPCPECSDGILDSPEDMNCPVCLGTGKFPPYFDPYPIRISLSGSPAHDGNRKMSQNGVSETQQRIGRVTAFPMIQANDIIASHNFSERYVVMDVKPVFYKTFPTARRLVLSLLPASDPVHKIPLRDPF